MPYYSIGSRLFNYLENNHLIKALYCHAGHQLACELELTGKQILCIIQGHRFIGTDFSMLELEPSDKPLKSSYFTLNKSYSDLTNFELIFEIEQHLMVGEQQISVSITVDYFCTDKEERTKFSMLWQGKTYQAKSDGYFEDAFEQLERQLEGPRFVHCLNCKYATYHPYGNSSFGCLLCFKQDKTAFTAAQDKFELLQLLERIKPVAVQETHHCAEFDFCNATKLVKVNPLS